MKKCPHCGQTLFNQATICTHCNNDVSDIPAGSGFEPREQEVPVSERPQQEQDVEIPDEAFEEPLELSPSDRITQGFAAIWAIITRKSPTTAVPHPEIAQDMEEEHQYTMRELGFFPFFNTFRHRTVDTLTTRIIRAVNMEDTAENRFFIQRVLYIVILLLILAIVIAGIVLGLIIRRGGL